MNGEDYHLAQSPLKTRQSNQTDVTHTVCVCVSVFLYTCVCALLANKVVSQQDYKDLCNIVAEGQRLLNVYMWVL